MDEGTSFKMLWVGIGLLLFVVVAAVVVAIVKTGQADADKAMNEYAEMSQEADKLVYSSYIGQVVKGSKAISLVSQWAAQPFCVQITNKAGETTTFNYTDKTLQTRLDSLAVDPGYKNATSTKYINPSGNFLCEAEMNTNDQVCLIKFTQQ